MKSSIFAVLLLIASTEAIRVDISNQIAIQGDPAPAKGDAKKEDKKEDKKDDKKEDKKEGKTGDSKEEKKEEKKEEEKKKAEPEAPDSPEEKKEKKDATAFISPEERKKMNPFDGLIHNDLDKDPEDAKHLPGGDKVDGVNFHNGYSQTDA